MTVWLHVDWIRLLESSARIEGKRAGCSGYRYAKVYAGAQAKAQVAELKPEFYVRGLPVSEQKIRVVRLETKQDHREA